MHTQNGFALTISIVVCLTGPAQPKSGIGVGGWESGSSARIVG